MFYIWLCWIEETHVVLKLGFIEYIIVICGVMGFDNHVLNYTFYKFSIWFYVYNGRIMTYDDFNLKGFVVWFCFSTGQHKFIYITIIIIWCIPTVWWNVWTKKKYIGK